MEDEDREPGAPDRIEHLHEVIGDEADPGKELVANPTGPFASLIANGPVTDETVTLTREQADRLDLAEGEDALVTPLRAVPKRRERT